MKPATFIKRNAATILTGIGAVGVVATAVTAVKATPKAIRLLEEAKVEKGEELTKTEVIVTAAPAYIPSIIIGTSTIACIFSANILNKRYQAALTSAYALLNSSYKEYRNKVKEIVGDETYEQIDEAITNDRYKEDDELQLFYDAATKQYFESTLFKVQQAEYFLNRNLVMKDYAYLNEWLEFLDIATDEKGWDLGWSTGSCMDMYWQPWVDFDHKHVTTEDGRECINIYIQQEPINGFENY